VSRKEEEGRFKVEIQEAKRTYPFSVVSPDTMSKPHDCIE
jgi:hypothetical protein